MYSNPEVVTVTGSKQSHIISHRYKPEYSVLWRLDLCTYTEAMQTDIIADIVSNAIFLS